MKKLIISLTIGIAAVFSANAYAQDPIEEVAPVAEAAPVVTDVEAIAGEMADIASPTDAGEAWELVGMAYAAFSEGNYMWGVALLLMVFIWVFNMVVKNRIPKKQLVYWSTGIAVVGAIAINLAAAPEAELWYKTLLLAIGKGITIGAAASGLWSLIGKKLFPTKKD